MDQKSGRGRAPDGSRSVPVWAAHGNGDTRAPLYGGVGDPPVKRGRLFDFS